MSIMLGLLIMFHYGIISILYIRCKEEFLKKWLDENPKIEIPEEGADEDDVDWSIAPEELNTLLQAFLAKDQN